MRRSLILFFLMAITLFSFIQPTQARPRGKSGVCGSIIPAWGFRYLGKNRYKVAYKSMPKLIKFYRKYYGYRSSKYKIIHMFSLPNVTAYHVKSMVPSSRWAGLNLVHYRRKNVMNVFVICRK